MKKKKKRKIIYFIIILIIIILSLIKYIDKTISPKLINYASLEIKKLSGLIITRSVTMDSLEQLKIDNLFTITKNNNNEILTVDFNTVLINKIITESTINIQNNLRKLEQGIIDENNEPNKNGVVLKLPLGIIYNNFILNNIGPNIPVKLKIVGDLQTKINTKITNYGINNALIEVTLDISVTEKVIIPLETNEITVTSTIPLIMKITNGTVPNFYSGEINKSSTFSIPIE